jgi:hypothetical protein
MEEDRVQTQDSYETGVFLFWHPQYNDWINGFQEWPISSFLERSVLYTSPISICPSHYGAEIDVDGDPRFWEAGSSRSLCKVMMFPATHFVYLPLIM